MTAATVELRRDQGPELDRDSLYARLLGSAVASLAPVVSGLHCARGDTHAAAQLHFEERHGVVTAVVGWVLRLPRAGAVVPTRLHIERGAGRETWIRYFGDLPPVTSHQHLEAGLLVERFGRLELSFAVTARRGGLDFRQTSAAVAVGGRRVQLPRALAPRVAARIAPRGDLAEVSVSVDLPAVGRLISYGGYVVNESAHV